MRKSRTFNTGWDCLRSHFFYSFAAIFQEFKGRQRNLIIIVEFLSSVCRATITAYDSRGEWQELT
jgi:hypothetical protein